MSQQRLYLVDSESPRSERRRRQRQQQSNCCSCVLVIVSLLIALIALRSPLARWWRERQDVVSRSGPTAMFPLSLQTDAPSYYRYELVRIDLHVVDPGGKPIRVAESPSIVVRRDDEVVVTIAGVRKLVPRYDPEQGVYQCYWPVPWRAKPGRYVAEAKMELENVGDWPWEVPPTGAKGDKEDSSPPTEGSGYCVAQAEFSIKSRPPPQLPPGLCAVTWEADFPQGSVRRPDGSRGDWQAMLDWAEFMGADCLWFRGAVTATFRGALSFKQPFVTHNLEAIPRLANAAHRRGLKFGVWASAYATYPHHTNKDKPAYDYAQDISRSTGKVSTVDFISLLDPVRREHLTDFFKQMQKMDNVDFIGLDYLRSDRGGYEMTDLFTSQMPVELPTGWEQWEQKRRWKYVATKVEGQWQTDADFYEQWNWWRAHRTAQIVSQIISEGHITKPVWIFSLGWMHGTQHGQDPVMLTDAGAALIAPMLYQVDSQPHFQAMVRSWEEYMDTGVANVAAGDEVDDHWHQRSRRPAAPELLYERMMTAHHQFIPHGQTMGAFWHDISRAAVRGNLGPYPGREWALAAAAVFSEIRKSWQVYPLKVEIKAAESAAIGSSWAVRVSIENLSQSDINDIEISVQKTPYVSPPGQPAKTVPKLGAGERIEVPMWVKIDQASAERANRFMVAVRINWPEGDYGAQFRHDLPRTIVVMQYVQGT